LITIRHINQEATALCEYLEHVEVNPGTGFLPDTHLSNEFDPLQAKEYVDKFQQWSEIVRFPIQSVVKKGQIQELLRKLHFQLGRLQDSGSVVSSFSHCSEIGTDIWD
jgi:hypothetical protein